MTVAKDYKASLSNLRLDICQDYSHSGKIPFPGCCFSYVKFPTLAEFACVGGTTVEGKEVGQSTCH